MIAVGVPACGEKGRLARLLHRKRARTQRSGAFVVLVALVSRRAFDDAKRWGLRTETSEADSVTGGRVEGRLAR